MVAQFARAMALQEMQEIADAKDFENERVARASQPAHGGRGGLAALTVVVGEPGGETLAAALLRVRDEKDPVVIFVSHPTLAQPRH